jgi:hypothetical protein
MKYILVLYTFGIKDVDILAIYLIKSYKDWLCQKNYATYFEREEEI